MFANSAQTFGLLFFTSMVALFATLRARAAIATYKEVPYPSHNNHTYDNGNYRHHSLLPAPYHSNNTM